MELARHVDVPVSPVEIETAYCSSCLFGGNVPSGQNLLIRDIEGDYEAWRSDSAASTGTLDALMTTDKPLHGALGPLYCGLRSRVACISDQSS